MNRDRLRQPNAVGSAVGAVILALCFIATEPGIARAERLPIKTYTTADGLVSNRISRIVRDSRGYLWFCTENGLSRFDGARFVNYTVEEGLPDDEVNDLLETRGGAYWIATGNGLVRYNPKGLPLPYGKASRQSERMFAVYRVGAERITSIIKALYEDRSGTIWIGTWRGLYRFEQAGDQARFHFVELGMPAIEPQIVRNILEDRKGALWVATDSGLYRRRPDGTVDRFTRDHGFSSERLIGLIEDRQGNLWVGDRYGGLCLLVADPGLSRPVVARQYATKDGLGCVRVGALYEATGGRIWIGADCGLGELLPDGAGSGRRVRMALSGEELTDTRVWSLAEDSHGNLWVGTANGAVKVARGGFTTFTEADGLGSRNICSIMETPSGELCVYTRSDHQAFINRFDGKRFIATKLNLPSQVRPDECAYCLWDREGRWWMAMTGQLLRFPKAIRVDDLGRLRPERFYPGIIAQARGQIYNFYEDTRGGLWISTQGCPWLLRWDRSAVAAQVCSEAESLLPIRAVAHAFAEDGAGNLWLGYGDAGLVRYAKGRIMRFTGADGIPAGAIQTMFLDGKGRLWIASSQSGLARIDDPAAERLAITSYTVAEGLSSNRVWSITEDSWGRLYIGTDYSLDRLDPATGRVRHFTTADGLANNQFKSSFRDSRGALWFGSHTGLSRFIPEADHPQPPPAVLINRLLISGAAYPVSDLGEPAVRDMELARSQGNIQIEFAGVAFGAGERLRYQHMLEGADQVWSQPAEQRAVHLGSLAPGRYRFLVRAVNAAGVVSETPASFSFTILSPLWQRWWFLALAATMAGLAAYTVYRYRVARLVALERVRTRIAADLHDDIGSSLSQISVLSEVLRNQLGEQEARVSKNLSLINRVSQEALDSMSDIVWAINPQQDRLSDLVRRMRRVASEALPARDIEFTFNAPGLDLKLGADIRRQVFLMFKETINNLVRHSNCALASIDLRIEGTCLVLTVTDNGKGFEPDQINEGNGLISLRRRARSLGGETVVSSRKGEGATVMIKVPYSNQSHLRRSNG
jgi:ligand-binding sensor domain-containing protein/signal transduction histidine kinase